MPAGPGPATRRSSTPSWCASHFGGTRNPLAIAWPSRIKPDAVPRPQFHHVNDIAPTIYELLRITPPKIVDGSSRTRSTASAWSTASPTQRRRTQARAVFREQRQSRHLPRWLVRRRLRPAHPLGGGRLGPDRLGLPTPTGGNSTTSARTSRRRMTSPPRAPTTRRAEGAIPRAGRGQQGVPDRRRPVAQASPRGPHQDALHELAFDASTTRMPEFTAPGLGRESSR